MLCTEWSNPHTLAVLPLGNQQEAGWVLQPVSTFETTEQSLVLLGIEAQFIQSIVQSLYQLSFHGSGLQSANP
jgi:hypothetical protein